MAKLGEGVSCSQGIHVPTAMYTKQTVTPLTINTKSNADGKGGIFTAAAFRYTSEPATPTSRRAGSVSNASNRQTAYENSSPRKRKSPPQSNMSVYPGSTASSPAMYVRALYDYDSDDRTSLSFRAGDIIQVLNQLESGWWDGIINDVRGWFPSNYCAVVTTPMESRRTEQQNGEEASGESGTDDDYEEHDDQGDMMADAGGGLPIEDAENAENSEQEEAAFWIPQATPDGRLFYFNTLTGVSTMELPLETPTSANETGPRDRMNIRVPDQTKPPPEMMARGLFHDEDEGLSASEAEGESLLYAQYAPRTRKRRSYISDGVSPAMSMDSLNGSPVQRSRNDSNDLSRSNLSVSSSNQYPNPLSAGANSMIPNLPNQTTSTALPGSFFDDGTSSPMTWNRLVENIRKAVESYRQAINNADRSEYVRKAEDISDHLRTLLAAASLTTDNHSGNSSIISTNKPLYPHFRDMMSRFSKMVLSSHIASADWPASDSYSKCLQEAENVMHGVYSFVQVARAQRGEDISRLTPGFVLGSQVGGSWQNNNLEDQDRILCASLVDQDEYEARTESTGTPLELKLLDRMDDLRNSVVASIRRLDEQLVVPDKIITSRKHEQISNAICSAAGKVVEYVWPWLSKAESVDLAPWSSMVQHSQLTSFTNQKQRIYDLIAGLVIACQAVASPLSDEWAEIRSDPLENRLQEVRNLSKQLETSITQLGLSLRSLHDVLPQRGQGQHSNHRRTDGGASYQSAHLRNDSRQMLRPQLGDIGQSLSFSEGIDLATENYKDNYKDNSKVKKFFGEVPAPIMPRESEETPSFLKLDYEGEISYDMKVNPPQLRGGTLTGLVEQLTRHDRLDSPFNNTFLLTYRSFTTAIELFEMLVKRFTIQAPRGISQEDYRTWVDKKQKPIRFRVVNILKSWFDNYWMENNDETSNQLLRRVYCFAKDSVATTNTPGHQPLMAVVEQRMRGQDASNKRLVVTQPTSAPTPIMPKNMKKLKFLDIDVTEFARQLTIIESRLYGKIKLTECLNKTWQKKLSADEPEPAPNVKALILHSNQLTNWVAEMILTQADVKKRVIVIKHFVSVADVGPFCI